MRSCISLGLSPLCGVAAEKGNRITHWRHRRSAPVPIPCMGSSAAMLIRVDDPALVDDLRAHYDRSGFDSEPVGGGMIDVARPDARDEEQERRAVVLHLRVWDAMNPDANSAIIA